MELKVTRQEAWEAARTLTVEYQTSWWGEEWVTRTKTLCRSIISTSMYRIQSTDELEAAEYAMFLIVVGTDGDDIGLGGIAVIE